MHLCCRAQRGLSPRCRALSLLLLLVSSAAVEAAKPAILLPENQKILARDNSPPGPSTDANSRYTDYSSICAPGDDKCYDHTNNTGQGSVTVSRRFPPAEQSPYNYAEVLHKSYIFYYQQRSGKLPFQRLAWRADSCLDCKGPAGEDLSGGYYEAGGSYLKFSFPTAFTFTQLAWGVVEFRDGYSKVKELDAALEAIRWGMDYLLNCHSAPFQFVAMFGSSEVDFGYFGPPEEHKQWTSVWGERVGTHITPKNPSSEICGEVAAAMAASAVAFRQTDPAYADTLVDHAKQMYEFGRKHPGSYMDSQLPGLKDSAKHYPSSGWHDEMAWGALWLHFATGEESYLQECLKWYDKLNAWSSENYAYDWDNKAPGLHVLLSQIFPSDMMKYSINAQTFFEDYLPGPKRTVFHTKKGLSWRNAWGVLRYSANNAFLAFVHAQQVYDQGDKAYAALLFTYGMQQINYMLGDSGRSYVVGFGKGAPHMAFHKWSHNAIIDYKTRGRDYDTQHNDFHNTDTPNKFIAYGALVGGPQSDDSFEDSRGWCCAAYNEVAIDYNAGFTSAVVRLVEYFEDQKPFSDCGLDLGWEHPNATLANKPQFAASDCYYGCCGGAPKRLQMREESSSSQRRKQLAPKREHRRPVRSNT